MPLHLTRVSVQTVSGVYIFVIQKAVTCHFAVKLYLISLEYGDVTAHLLLLCFCINVCAHELCLDKKGMLRHYTFHL